MISRNRSLSTLALLIGMMWAIGCGERDNSLFAGEQPGAGGAPGQDAGDDDDASLDDGGEDANGGGTGGSGGSPLVDAGTDAQDAGPDVCSYEPVPGPLARNCRPPTDNECDGLYEDGAFPNGAYGNGLDDDCDGIVDEGCECGPDSPIGTTKTCFLVPPSQIDPSTKAPVGWCAGNAQGTMSCIPRGSGGLTKGYWDGYCKGAEQPFADDVCAPGDYDCDGLPGNSKTSDCGCDPEPPVVKCPTAPIVTSPFPDPADLTKKKNNPLDPEPGTPFVIDGRDWIVGKDPALATHWKWTVTGGDCDNILPHPTFAIFNGPSVYSSARIGTKTNTLGNGTQSGFVVDGPGSQQHQIWPAFALSGDYVVKGEFDLDGERHSCSVKVKVGWPGIRTELCWDTIGTSDLDLHFARLQGQSCSSYGWFDTCANLDCQYSNCKSPLAWGYPTSETEACQGWGSRRASSCSNPRIDQDVITCSPSQVNPLATDFCAAENTSIDNPNVGDRFAVGVHYYAGGNGAKPRVNVYCNGERRLSFGHDPTTMPPVDFPRLLSKTASRAGGDFWSVARVTWLGGKEGCEVEPIPSQNPRPNLDGSTAFCVDTGPRNGTSGSNEWHFMSPSSSVPTGPKPSPFEARRWFCWH